MYPPEPPVADTVTLAVFKEHEMVVVIDADAITVEGLSIVIGYDLLHEYSSEIVTV